MASRPASAAATTEAQPFTPQAHGTRAGATARTRARASGNGRPMTKASGATKATARAARGTAANCRPRASSHGPTRACSDRQHGDQQRYPSSSRPNHGSPAPRPRLLRLCRHAAADPGEHQEGGEGHRERVHGMAEQQDQALQHRDLDQEKAQPDQQEVGGGGAPQAAVWPDAPAVAPAAGSAPAPDSTATPSVASCNGQPQSSRPALPCRAAAQSAGSARQRKKSRK